MHFLQSALLINSELKLRKSVCFYWMPHGQVFSCKEQELGLSF